MCTRVRLRKGVVQGSSSNNRYGGTTFTTRAVYRRVADFQAKRRGGKIIAGSSGTSCVVHHSGHVEKKDENHGSDVREQNPKSSDSSFLNLLQPNPPAQSSSTYPSTAPSIPALISKAQSIIEHCDYDLTNEFLQQILQRSPKNAEAREMLGVVQFETGLVQEARKVGLSRLILYFVNWWYVFRTSRPTVELCIR